MGTVWILLAQLVSVQLSDGTIINLARGKPVAVSSRYENRDPRLAVDGDTRAVDPNVITTDVNQPFAWWTVDLQTEVNNATVEIYFRTEYKYRRNGVLLYTSLRSFSAYPGGRHCHSVTGNRQGTNIDDVVTVACSGKWRHLMAYTRTNNDRQGPILDFGEIRILVCSNGTYGQNCRMSCGQCAVTPSMCDRFTGACPPGGCKPGWVGTQCQDCETELYGSNCDKYCVSRHCADASASCDRTGKCSPGGCMPGWELLNCTKTCPSGTYGSECKFSCGNCSSDDICNHVTGHCPGDCKAGWRGSQCKETCKSGKFGINCEENCGRCIGTCDLVSGYCPDGCQEGYNGTRCKTLLLSSNPDSSVLPAVAVVITVVLIIVISAAVVTVYRRRKANMPTITYDRTRSPDLEARSGDKVYMNVSVTQNEMNRPSQPPVKPERKTLQYQPDNESEEEILDDEPLPNRDYYNDIADVIREIPVADLEDTVQKLKHRKGGFEAEYYRLPTGFTASYDDSQKPENSGKNKFKGYYPYDHNRVRLSVLANIPGSDYINASLMHSYDRSKTYIAAQAPNKKTVGDFWRMIWEQRCGVVVMLTGLVEERRVKCQQYWDDDGTFNTEQFCVVVEMTDVRANFIIRHTKVTSKQNGESRPVVQYHYTSWPDHGVPDTLALVSFIWRIRRMDTHKDGPLLVHCSAGIGRTGTYIAVDSLLDQARREGMVDVQGYVSVMRGQRKNMIQTKEQYECVFDCLVEMTKFGNTSMDVENFTTSYSSRGIDSMVDRKTIRELTQCLITEDRNDSPARHSMWVDGNQDFIVRVGPTLRQLNGYLMAVTPPPGLEKLLWKLVEENNVHNVIVISPIQETLLGRKGASKAYGDITVKTMEETILTSDVSLVTLQLQVKKESTHNVKVFKFSRSPTTDSMASIFLNHVNLQHLLVDVTPAVIIHRNSDWKYAVMFGVMGNILSGIQMDRHVDVIGHVRNFLKCCPDMSITEDDVLNLHKFALQCVEITAPSNTYANM